MKKSNLPKSKRINLVHLFHEHCNNEALAALYDKLMYKNFMIILVCIDLSSPSHDFPAVFSLALCSQYELLVACRQ